MTITNTPAWGSTEGGERVQLASASLHLEYDLGSGGASLFTAPSRPLVLSATAGATLGQGLTLASDPRYTRVCRIVSTTAPNLVGTQLQIGRAHV